MNIEHEFELQMCTRLHMYYMLTVMQYFTYFQAAVICGCIGICAESSYEALKKRHDQGWVLEIIDDLDELIRRVIEAKAKKQVILRFLFVLGKRFG